MTGDLSKVIEPRTGGGGVAAGVIGIVIMILYVPQQHNYCASHHSYKNQHNAPTVAIKHIDGILFATILYVNTYSSLTVHWLL